MLPIESIKLALPKIVSESKPPFALSEKAVIAWLESLPRAHLGQLSQQLFETLGALVQTPLSIKQRAEVLPVLEETAEQVLENLSKLYLNQPVIASESAIKSAKLAAGIENRLAFLYMQGVESLFNEFKKNGKLGRGEQKLMRVFLHTSLVVLTYTLKRNIQLYQDPNKYTWYNIHQLYHIFLITQLVDKELSTSKGNTATIAQLYKRLLLLGTCRANQLRQVDVDHVFSQLLAWSDRCHVTEYHDNILFRILPNKDYAPIYNALLADQDAAYALSFNPSSLVNYLKDELALSSGRAFGEDKATQIISEVMLQLIDAWSAVGSRKAKRRDVEGSIQIALGLPSAHYFIAGEMPFDELINLKEAVNLDGEESNFYLKQNNDSQHDVWNSPYQAQTTGGLGLNMIEMDIVDDGDYADGKDKRTYSSYNARLVNISANGFCILWLEDKHANALKPGEVIAIRESNQDDWSLTTLRWVKQLENSRCQMGLELLATHPSPYGARLVNAASSGQGVSSRDFMQVLVLPGVSGLNVAPTVIAPKMPFKVGHKLMLVQNNSKSRVYLKECIESSKSYNRFVFDKIPDDNYMSPVIEEEKDPSIIDFN